MKGQRLHLALLASFVSTVAIVSLFIAVFQVTFPRSVPPQQAIFDLRFEPDAKLLPQLEQLVERDDERSLELLVLALVHERPALAQAARQLMAAKLDRWSLMPTRESAPRVDRLARQLRQHAARVPPAMHPYATDVVTRLLLWPTASVSKRQPEEAAERLVDDCVAALRQWGTSAGRPQADEPRGATDLVAARSVTSRSGDDDRRENDEVTRQPADSTSPSRSGTDSTPTRTAGEVPARK